MSSPACVSCQDLLQCNDSPLSVTGNIIGILTFAGAIMISLQVYTNAMIHAERNIFAMTETVRQRLAEAGRLRAQLRDLLQAQGHIGSHEQYNYIAQTFSQSDEELESARRLLEKVDQDQTGGRKNLWLRARFVMEEEVLRNGLEKADKALASLKDIASQEETKLSPQLSDCYASSESILRELQTLKKDLKDQETVRSKDMSNVATDGKHFRAQILRELAELRKEIRSLAKGKI